MIPNASQMISGFELPTIFCNIDENGIIKKEDFVFHRKSAFQSTGDFEKWTQDLEKIHEDGAASVENFAKWRDMLWEWTMVPSKVAFCTVSLQRLYNGETINHCVVLLFWKDERKMEIFDARGSNMSQYEAFPNFYKPQSLLAFSKSILVEWNLIRRMQRAPLPTLDFMQDVPKTFLKNPGKCRNIGIFYIYTRLRSHRATKSYSNNKERALEITRQKFATRRRTRNEAAVQRRTRQKIQLRF